MGTSRRALRLGRGGLRRLRAEARRHLPLRARELGLPPLAPRHDRVPRFFLLGCGKGVTGMNMDRDFLLAKMRDIPSGAVLVRSFSHEASVTGSFHLVTVSFGPLVYP